MAKKIVKKEETEVKAKSPLTPRVTEKAAFSAESGVYTFDVPANTNKQEVEKVIFALYKVKPVKVNMVVMPRKKVAARGRGNAGVRGGGKKALVFLKKGDKIDFA